MRCDCELTVLAHFSAKAATMSTPTRPRFHIQPCALLDNHAQSEKRGHQSVYYPHPTHATWPAMRARHLPKAAMRVLVVQVQDAVL